MLPTQKPQSQLPQQKQQKQQKKKQQQQLPEQIKLTVTKENPWLNNKIMFPPQINIDRLDWFPITVIYKPKSTRKTRDFGGGSLIFETHPAEYIFRALGYEYGNKLIVKPTSFQRKAEYEEFFGNHDSLQKLHQGRTYPLVQINTQNTLSL